MRLIVGYSGCLGMRAAGSISCPSRWRVVSFAAAETREPLPQ